MLSSVFDKLHDLWLPGANASLELRLEGLPKSTADLKMVEVYKKKGFDLIKTGDQLSEKVLFKKKLYLMNSKTGNLYRPFSQNDLKTIKSLEKEVIELNNEGSFQDYQFPVKKELGKICAKVIFLNFPELILKIAYIVFSIFRDLVYEFRHKNFKLAFPSMVFGTFGAILDIFRAVFYSIGIQIAAFEGVFFDPVRGFFKIEQLERLAAREIDKKDDPCYRAMKNDYKFGATERANLPWYNEIKVIHGSNIDQKISSAFIESTNKYVTIASKDISNLSDPEIFPLTSYAWYHLKKLIA